MTVTATATQFGVHAPQQARQAAQRPVRARIGAVPVVGRGPDLSRRERQCLAGICRGLTNAQIGAEGQGS